MRLRKVSNECYELCVKKNERRNCKQRCWGENRCKDDEDSSSLVAK